MTNITSTTIVGTVITVLVTLLLQTLTGYLAHPALRVTFGDALPANGKWLAPVTIANFSADLTDTLQLMVPVQVDSDSIVATRPITVERVPNSTPAGSTQRIRISGLPASTITQLLIPVDSPLALASMDYVAGSVKGGTVERSPRAQSPLKSAALQASANAAFVAVLYAIAMVWFLSHTKELKKSIKRLRRQVDTAGTRLDEVQDDMLQIRERYVRIRILLLTRIAAYQRELEFWRTCIRATLRSHRDGESTADALIREVPKALKTTATLSESSPDDLLVVAGMLERGSTLFAKARKTGSEPTEDAKKPPRSPKRKPGHPQQDGSSDPPSHIDAEDR